MASSCLAIYLIHGSDVIFRHGIKNVALNIQMTNFQIPLQIIAVLILAIIVVVGSIIIDKLLTPLWNLVGVLSEKLSASKLGIIVSKYK
jgi:hypothetical protein